VRQKRFHDFYAAARDRETAASRIGAVQLFVRLSVCLSPKCKKTRFSQKQAI